MQNDKFVLSVARAFFHYAKHGFFLEPNQILSQMPRIAHLPAIIINGRWDAICLPEMAYAVYQNWPQSQLWMIPDAGHASSESSLAGALVTPRTSSLKKSPEI